MNSNNSIQLYQELQNNKSLFPLNNIHSQQNHHLVNMNQNINYQLPSIGVGQIPYLQNGSFSQNIINPSLCSNYQDFYSQFYQYQCYQAIQQNFNQQQLLTQYAMNQNQMIQQFQNNYIGSQFYDQNQLENLNSKFQEGIYNSGNILTQQQGKQENNLFTDVYMNQIQQNSSQQGNQSVSTSSQLKQKKQQREKQFLKSEIKVEAGQKKRQRINKPYQDTKNVPKNYTKAILRYIKHKQDASISILGGSIQQFKNFLKLIESKKDKIISIKEFRSLFSNQIENEESDAMRKLFRIMAFKFCREEVNSYLKSNRKIKSNNSMLKYRRVIQQGLHDPENFYSWKNVSPLPELLVSTQIKQQQEKQQENNFQQIQIKQEAEN